MHEGMARAKGLKLLASGVVLIAMATASVAAASSSTSVSLRPAGPKRSLLVPLGFRLQGSNGYSFDVVGAQARKEFPAKVVIIVSREHTEAAYFASATVTDTSIQADFGDLGEIAVTFHPSGRPATARAKCGGKPVSFDSGYYEGTIEFHGEEGYTEVAAASAPGSIDFFLDALCFGISTGRGGPFMPGAELRIRNPQLGPELSVIKNGPSARARFEVSVSEYHEGISILRSTTLLLPARTFRYNPRLETATLRPPAPFAGTARFDRHKKASRRWSGDLTVDMPGRADVPLTGSKLRATLIHAGWERP